MSIDEFMYQDMVKEIERLKGIQSDYVKLLQVLQEKDQVIGELETRLSELRFAYDKLLEVVKAR
jgi:hypothetical protein